MALVGGGGAPNVVGGGAPAGVGTSLNFVGDHAYAYSGKITTTTASSAATTYLDFSTGNQYIVGTFHWLEAYTGNADRFIDIQINGESVMAGQADDSANQLYAQPIEILLPPYSRITVKYGIGGQTVDVTWIMQGRVYA
jgi:hypothetical protein